MPQVALKSLLKDPRLYEPLLPMLQRGDEAWPGAVEATLDSLQLHTSLVCCGMLQCLQDESLPCSWVITWA